MHSFDGRVSDHLTDSSLLADVASSQMHDSVRPLLQVDEIEARDRQLLERIFFDGPAPKAKVETKPKAKAKLSKEDQAAKEKKEQEDKQMRKEARPADLVPALEETGGQKIYLDAYQKCPLDWLIELTEGPLLERCRTELKNAGYACLLSDSGAKIFVRPEMSNF